MKPSDIRPLLDSFRAATRVDANQRTVPSQRRERRADVVTYRVRVDLNDTKPPLWRRLELTSDMHLDELHDVVQIATRVAE